MRDLFCSAPPSQAKAMLLVTGVIVLTLRIDVWTIIVQGLYVWNVSLVWSVATACSVSIGRGDSYVWHPAMLPDVPWIHSIMTFMFRTCQQRGHVWTKATPGLAWTCLNGTWRRRTLMHKIHLYNFHLEYKYGS